MELLKSFIYGFNLVLGILVTLCYSYQFVYAVIGFFTRPRSYTARKNHRFAILIPARNEEAVIADLIRSIQNQDYPRELLDTYVVADNCTDDTAAVARAAGARVLERFNKTEVGKSYALDALLYYIRREYPQEHYDGYFIFDADNLLDERFVTEMNGAFDAGYEVVTGFLNAKNYQDNMVTSGYSIAFLRDSRFVNNARGALGLSASVAGTGFLFSDKCMREMDGWNCHLLTEDLEFSARMIAAGRKIGYCPNAVFYNEQPSTFAQSCTQRIRWMKGHYQTFGVYGKSLFRRFFKERDFSGFDFATQLFPVYVLSSLTILINLLVGVITLFAVPKASSVYLAAFAAAGSAVLGFLFAFFTVGVAVSIAEWKRIYAPAWKKVLYMFTFPLFTFTYLPISCAALFASSVWKKTRHSVSCDVNAVRHRVTKRKRKSEE